MISIIVPVNAWVDDLLGKLAIAELEPEVDNIDTEYDQVVSPPEWNVVDH
jgi:hypothetical protein